MPTLFRKKPRGSSSPVRPQLPPLSHPPPPPSESSAPSTTTSSHKQQTGLPSPPRSPDRDFRPPQPDPALPTPQSLPLRSPAPQVPSPGQYPSNSIPCYSLTLPSRTPVLEVQYSPRKPSLGPSILCSNTPHIRGFTPILLLPLTCPLQLPLQPLMYRPGRPARVIRLLTLI